jgi:RNA polymerase sigma factor (sigma-70 family)
VAEKLFLEVYPLVRRAANVRASAAFRALGAAGLDREDLVQEITLAVWLNLERFDPLRASLPTFVERVSATKVASILRRGNAQKRAKTGFDTPDVSPLRMGFTVELRVDVRRALGMLNRVDQKIALLRLHFKPTEIARILSCSRTSVYRSLERIRRALERFDLDKY